MYCSKKDVEIVSRSFVKEIGYVAGSIIWVGTRGGGRRSACLASFLEACVARVPVQPNGDIRAVPLLMASGSTEFSSCHG